MSTETTRRTDEVQGDIVHVYDGIEEADNRLPRWWLWSFYLTVIFGALYWLYFESFGVGNGPLESYNVERMKALDTGEPVTDEELVALTRDKLAIEAGSATFHKNCTRCHGDHAEGKIGPNLTDAYWIGGGAPRDIFETIYRGRQGKGMPSWGPNLGRGGAMQAAAYVLTLRNTNVPGKAPQGDKWEPPPPPAADAGPEAAESTSDAAAPAERAVAKGVGDSPGTAP